MPLLDEDRRGEAITKCQPKMRLPTKVIFRVRRWIFRSGSRTEAKLLDLSGTAGNQRDMEHDSIVACASVEQQVGQKQVLDLRGMMDVVFVCWQLDR